jgi:ABC-type phosphate/phosphonate transport system substrate-binding protein
MSIPSPLLQHRRGLLVLAYALTILLAVAAGLSPAQRTKIDTLRIGRSGSLTAGTAQKEKTALESLRAFIKDETGLKNEIFRQKDWKELAEKLSKGRLHVGVFQGFEFAWAQAKYSDLKPLALAVNVYTYPVAHVVDRRDNSAKDFAGLRGQSLCIPAIGESFLRLYVDRQCQDQGKTAKTFFSKITKRDNVEDALDDLVDNIVQVVAVDRAGLEAYKQRKPGRFKQLKAVTHSQPFPPPVVAYYGSVLDRAARRRFHDGLLGASRKEKGQMMLTLFHITGFEDAPKDFGEVLTKTRKAYPPPDSKKK